MLPAEVGTGGEVFPGAGVSVHYIASLTCDVRRIGCYGRFHLDTSCIRYAKDLTKIPLRESAREKGWTRFRGQDVCPACSVAMTKAAPIFNPDSLRSETPGGLNVSS